MEEKEEKKKFSREEIAGHFSSAKKVKVVFEKKDGTIRTMLCTRDPETIPEEFRPQDKDETDRPGRPTPDHLFAAFDTEANGWRSITVDKIISIDPA
jgi:hypothetical protein